MTTRGNICLATILGLVIVGFVTMVVVNAKKDYDATYNAPIIEETVTTDTLEIQSSMDVDTLKLKVTDF